MIMKSNKRKVEQNMKQVVMEGPKKSKVIDVEIPKINDNQLLVKLLYTGMCHSEWYPWSVAKKGDRFGHESIGIVADKGKNVKGFKIGDRITGLGGGGFREYITMDPSKVFVVPENLKTEDAIIEPLACMMSVAERIRSQKVGDTIAVVGAGYMGLGMISLFRTMGYVNIIAVDEREIALENAKKMGATETYLPHELPHDYILDWNNWEKPDLTRDGHITDIFNTGLKTVVEFTGTQSGLTLAGNMVCAHGTLGIAGFHNDGMRTLDLKLWGMKGMTMYNCHERRIDYEVTLCKRALDLLAQDKWKFKGVTNHIYGLDEFDRGNYEMEAHTNNFIKGAVKCD